MSPARPGPITGDTIVDDLMGTHTATISAFIRRRMLCVGCPVSRLHDVREACREHGVALEEFLAEVNAIVRGEAG